MTDDEADDQTDDEPVDPDEPDEKDDPFADLNPGEREGDPFDAIGDPNTEPDQGRDETPPTVDEARSDAAPIGRPGDEGFAGGDGASDGGDDLADDDQISDEGTLAGDDFPGDDLPGVDLDAAADEADPFAGEDGVFQRVDVGRVDADRVWDQLTDEDWSIGDVSPSDDSRYAVVSKHEYCEGCEFFSPPPTVACQHDRAEIVEFVDVEHVRLKNCPIVARRRELERGE